MQYKHKGGHCFKLRYSYDPVAPSWLNLISFSKNAKLTPPPPPSGAPPPLPPAPPLLPPLPTSALRTSGMGRAE